MVLTLAPPSAPFSYPSNPSSSSNYERTWIPVKVEHWDVKDNVEESLSSANKKKRVYDLTVTTCTKFTVNSKRMESYVVTTILLTMQAFMDKKEPLSMFVSHRRSVCSKKKMENDGIGFGEGATASEMVELYVRGPIADVIVSLGEKDVVAVEVKKGGLGPDQGDSWDLHKAWTQCTNKQGEGGGCEALGIMPAHRDKVMRCINQLYSTWFCSAAGGGCLLEDGEALGVVVPRLVGYGTTNKGRIVFVATELIEGVQLGEVAATEEAQTVSLEALDAVHACGLLHGDIRRSNIMVVQGVQLSVRILDFGFLSVTSKKSLQKAERIYLECLLTDMVKYPGK